MFATTDHHHIKVSNCCNMTQHNLKRRTRKYEWYPMGVRTWNFWWASSDGVGSFQYMREAWIILAGFFFTLLYYSNAGNGEVKSKNNWRFRGQELEDVRVSTQVMNPPLRPFCEAGVDFSVGRRSMSDVFVNRKDLQACLLIQEGWKAEELCLLENCVEFSVCLTQTTPAFYVSWPTCTHITTLLVGTKNANLCIPYFPNISCRMRMGVLTYILSLCFGSR